MKKLLILLLACLIPFAAPAEGAARLDVPGLLRPGKAERLRFSLPGEGPARIGVFSGCEELATVYEADAAPAGETAFYWDGTDADGDALHPGAYTLVLHTPQGSAEQPVTIGDPAPLILWLDADSHIDYSSFTPWEGTAECSMPGKLTMEILTADGAVPVLEADADEGENLLTWDGLLKGSPLSPGHWDAVFRLTDETGFSSTAEMISVEVSAPALATDVEYHTPGGLGGVSCEHDVCFWKLNMGEMDEDAIWQVLIQPVTVLQGDERKQVKVRREPREDCTDYVGEVTCMSQAVHVLRRGEDWTLIEAYSSSVEGSAVAVWARQFQGHVKTSLLKERQVDQHTGVVIDKLQQRLYIFRDGKLFSTLLCSTGFPRSDTQFHETPAGEFLAVSWAGGFWSGSLYCDMGIRINDGILLHEVPCLIEVDEVTGQEERDYDRCERYLGEKASHGCIRIQRSPSPEGASMRWLWENLSRESSARSKIIIWDEAGRVLGYPDDALTLYYNPDGGRNYHAHPNCRAVSDRFLPLSPFLYGELEEGRFASLTPCGSCTPQLRRDAIDTINAENTR